MLLFQNNPVYVKYQHKLSNNTKKKKKQNPRKYYITRYILCINVKHNIIIIYHMRPVSLDENSVTVYFHNRRGV